ncbi:hypothetical protein [Streptomyces chiangmaiensis]|uniref:Uncharacterized protein n=2 Tax=Streptomyces chiangmaiensis TaxID=766497 RepID=A0ABU7FXE4_9ACTN|nr:hypothetical protein [Streptomyces chiangmaiensis]MED7828604.1 hypothetical protein [Streptomyces chiangmaiensis]
MTGRITAAADWREAGSYESRRAATSHNPQLAETIPDHAQAAAHLRRSGRGLVSYHRIPADAPALADLFNSPQDTR